MKQQLYNNLIIYGAVAQLARAPALQAGGQEFDSPQLHHTNLNVSKIIWKKKRVVQGKRQITRRPYFVYVDEVMQTFYEVMRSLLFQR